MKIQPFKRINIEDYPDQYQDLISNLGSSINLFTDEVYNALQNNLSITDNLNQSKVSIKVSVDASGAPTQTLQFKTNLTASCYGINVVNVVNNTNSTTYPTGMPFISFSQSNGVITVNNITGLQPSNQYTLSLILYS